MVEKVNNKTFYKNICSDSRDGHFRKKGRGGQNPCGKTYRTTVPPLRVYFLRF